MVSRLGTTPLDYFRVDLKKTGQSMCDFEVQIALYCLIQKVPHLEALMVSGWSGNSERAGNLERADVS